MVARSHCALQARAKPIYFHSASCERDILNKAYFDIYMFLRAECHNCDILVTIVARCAASTVCSGTNQRDSWEGMRNRHAEWCGGKLYYCSEESENERLDYISLTVGIVFG